MEQHVQHWRAGMSTRLFAALTVLLLAPLAFAQVQLQFLSPVSPAHGTTKGPFTYSSVVELPNGGSLLIGSAPAVGASAQSTHKQIVLAATGVAGGPPAFPAIGGSGNDVSLAAAVDSKGNIWIVGSTDSDDFILVNPIAAKKVPYRTAGFVLELDPTAVTLLFSTYLGGDTLANPFCLCPYSTEATAITIDSTGNVYVGGTTDEPDFPTTPGVFMKTAAAGVDSFADNFYYSFAVKISPAGKLLYGTFLGTGTADCEGGTCEGEDSTFSHVTSLAVDSAGALAVAGIQGGESAPTTAFLSKLSADANSFTALPSFPVPGTLGPMVIAEDANSNLNVFGAYNAQGGLITPGLFAAKLSSNGSVIYSTDLGQSPDANLTGMVLDSSGNAYLVGTSSSAQFPALAGIPAIGSGFVLRLNPTGTAAETLFRLPATTIGLPPAMDANGNLLLANRIGWLLTLAPSYDFQTPAVVSALNAASYVPLPDLVPGQLISLFGFGLSEAQVSIGGAAATVLYSGANQLNVQVPFNGAGADIQVAATGGTVSANGLPGTNGTFAGTSLGIFTTDGSHAAALNQDGTVNSASNPAAKGSIVSLFGSGALWPKGSADGATATQAMPLDQEQNQFEILDASGTPLSILYEGAAPGLIFGVFQLNVQLTPDAVLPLTLEAPSGLGTGMAQASNSVQVFVK